MKILVADDSKTNLAIITSSLTRLGHTVIQSNNGEEAVNLFKEDRPDLIILDVMMEPMDGFECARRIREINSEEWIPIIFLSASVDDKSIAKGIDAGGDDYLTKPFSEITLAAKIKAMQRISDMRTKLFETTQKLYLLSSTDPLTGIYNRLQFDRSIKEIIAAADHYHHKVGLLFIDLDNFKGINDTFGHQVGDQLLVEVAKRIKTCLKANDFIARLGGDEFSVVLSQINDIQNAESVASEIINVLAKDYNLDGHHIRNGASIGVACYPIDARNATDLVLNADVAMYHAKASGRNNYQLFTPELNDKYKQKLSLEHSLQFALERHELFLNYQPVFDLQKRVVCGLEALLCWNHPKFGMVSPSIFIPIAEEIGMIHHIGYWIISTACKQAAKWQLNRVPNFKFSINISSRQLTHEEFNQQVSDILTETQIDPKQLELELTETTVMTTNSLQFRESIKRLHELGINISIDDFGTGYSSLIRLKHLPINTLKIERTFVQDAVLGQNGAIIVSCLIALGKNLGMNVIAEGIESREQLNFLIDNHCPQGQGYYLAKPMNAIKMTQFLANNLDMPVKV